MKSGSWFIQMRLNGVSVPVTASSEKECRYQAQLIKAEYKAGKREIQSTNKTDITLNDLLSNYNKKYESVLSPATIRGYEIVRKHRFPDYMNKSVKSIKDWQEMINAELKTKSEHTVKNGWGCVSAALRDAGIPVPIVKLAKVPVKDMAFLEPEEIPLFCSAAEGDSAEIEMLLALHGLRMSEVLSVVKNHQYNLKSGTITVRGASVLNKENKLVDKSTNKNKTSTRVVPIMIPRLKELLKKMDDGSLQFSGHTAPTVLAHVHQTCERAGVTDVTCHGLRHTFASLAYSLKMSERMTMELGGWSDASTMHKIYIRLAQRDKDNAKNAMTAFYETMQAKNANKNANG